MKLFELVIARRAGFIPYVIEDGEPVFFFMIPSETSFGGKLPQIAKGQVDAGEDVNQAAIREAGEELGLKKSNLKKDTIKLIWRGKLRGSKETYEMTVFTGEVKNKLDFKQPHFETGERRWLTVSEYSKEGHEPHLKIVRAAHKLIKDSLPTELDNVE